MSKIWLQIFKFFEIMLGLNEPSNQSLPINNVLFKFITSLDMVCEKLTGKKNMIL